MSIRIVLADDHTIVRQGLSKCLDQETDMEVIGQAHDGYGTIEIVQTLKPDVVIMDIGMPELNGIEATRQIKRDFKNVRIIALSMHSAKRFVIEMFKAGANGYLLKDCDFEELATAIRAVFENKSYLSPSITGIVVEGYVHSANDAEFSAYTTLTKRERQILQLLTEGQTTKQIARQLFISPKTVEAHRLRIMGKLDIDNVAQLTKYAIQEGLTSVDL